MAVKYLDKPFDWKHVPLWFHERGLSETATGYGGRLRSTRMLRIHGESRWRRVYVMLYSNSGTCYVRIRDEIFIVRDSDFSATETRD